MVLLEPNGFRVYVHFLRITINLITALYYVIFIVCEKGKEKEKIHLINI